MPKFLREKKIWPAGNWGKNVCQYNVKVLMQGVLVQMYIEHHFTYNQWSFSFIYVVINYIDKIHYQKENLVSHLLVLILVH